jgi:hypothetical protein
MSTKAWFTPLQPTLPEILTELMQSLLILSVPALLIEWLAPAWRIQLYLLILAALGLHDLIRKTSQILWQFVFLSLAVVIIPMNLPLLPAVQTDFGPRLILGLSLAFLAIRSFYLRLNEQTRPCEQGLRSEQRQPGSLAVQALALLLVIGLDIIAHELNLVIVSQIYFYLSITYLILALVRWRTVAISNQLKRYWVMPSQPTASVVRYNKILLLGFASGATVLLVISPVLRLHELLPWLGQRLLDLIHWLQSILAALMAALAPDGKEPAPTPTPMPTPTPAIPANAIKEPPAWLLFLLDLLSYLLTALVIVGLVALCIYGLYRIYRRFYDRQPDSDRRESLLPNLANLVQEQVEQSRSRLGQQFGQSPEQKIRRLYFRLIAAQIRHGLNYEASLTARQLGDLLDHDRFPELAAITELYEKARYGSGSCTPADAARMQTLVRSLHRQSLLPG